MNINLHIPKYKTDFSVCDYLLIWQWTSDLEVPLDFGIAFEIVYKRAEDINIKIYVKKQKNC